MDTLKQQALDYALGSLPKEESILFEALLEKDDQAQQLLIEAREDCANLSLTSPESELNEELRMRILENCQPKQDFDPFLETEQITRLRSNYSSPDIRYTGGGGSTELSSLKHTLVRDELYRIYEKLIELTPLVSGDSSASAGDFSDLRKWINNANSLTSQIEVTLSYPLPLEDPSARSAQRSLLAALPSLIFFIERIREDSATLADVRRIFYLCRDQLKIMRASFGDIDPSRLVDDEKLRLHSAGLLRSKWWGSEHGYFSANGKTRCGHFFDGPVTERCVEFAEYDANLYCLANILAPRSGNGEFHLELLKDAIPGGVLAVAMAETKIESHGEIEKIVQGTHHNGHIPHRDYSLWGLVQESMHRGHQNVSIDAVRDNPLYGCQRYGNGTYLWFAWPSIENDQEGA